MPDEMSSDKLARLLFYCMATAVLAARKGEAGSERRLGRWRRERETGGTTAKADPFSSGLRRAELESGPSRCMLHRLDGRNAWPAFYGDWWSPRHLYSSSEQSRGLIC